MDDDDFFEDDEPIETIREILRRPVDAITAPPRGLNEHLDVTYGSFVIAYSYSEPNGSATREAVAS